ncbi:hypothetical protein [uncultured Rubinisphaera sp.]|uniref:hypothetical protein n=1 Tax=uncultured Rubinisphaera sp. TaxID=1678686 RepID=UPI0030D956D6
MKQIFLAMITFSLISDTVVPAAVQQFSIPEFVENKDQWNELVGETLRIEGRYSSFSPSSMRFQKCEISFQLPAGTPRPLGRSKNLEVTGELIRELNEFKFQVNSLQVRPDDLEQVQLSKALLPKNDAAPWYELGIKTTDRAKFYEDEILKLVGEELLVEAIRIERSRQKQPTAAFLSDLSAKAAKLGVSKSLYVSLKHESLRQQFEEGRIKPDFDYKKFLQELETALPGSQVPLTSLKGDVFDAYRKQPRETFAKASPHAQQQLSRLFHLEVLRTQIQSKLADGGSNGDRLAKEYELLAPDDPEYAEELRAAALMFRTKNILTSTRTELLAVAEQYRDQGDAEMAETAMARWLNHRVEQLDRAGPSDYLQTALDFDSWLQKRERAEEILQRGIQKYPDDAALLALLTRWDFAKNGDQWISKADLPMSKPNEIEQAIQSGRVVAGMSRAQVASTLGAPRTVTRIASQKENLLIWNYPDVKLAVRFEQLRQRNDYVVVNVGPLPR